jgi:hypothetical protein
MLGRLYWMIGRLYCVSIELKASLAPAEAEVGAVAKADQLFSTISVADIPGPWYLDSPGPGCDGDIQKQYLCFLGVNRLVCSSPYQVVYAMNLYLTKQNTIFLD